MEPVKNAENKTTVPMFYATLNEKIRRTEDIVTFRFNPEKSLSFVPGQFVQVLFDAKNYMNREVNKYLSFSSSPHHTYFEVTKRLSSSSFSEHLRELEIGSTVMFKGPLGNCVFKEDYRKIAFLVGGIGITPVISMIEYIEHNSLATDVIVLYSNKDEANIAFRKELERWESVLSGLSVYYIVTDCQPSDTRCTHGVIDTDTIEGNIRDWCERVFFIFGPPKMVQGMAEMVTTLGCESAQIKKESFIGY